MADSITMRGPGFTAGGTGGGTSMQGDSNGGGAGFMNDDYYHRPGHPAQAKDPGVKLNVLAAGDKPLDFLAKARDGRIDTSSFLAKDPSKNITVLTAKDGLLPDGFVIRDNHRKTAFFVAKDTNGHSVAMWARDFGPLHVTRVNDMLHFMKQQEEDKSLPDCWPDTPYDTPCAPRDCWEHELSLPCGFFG
jgi:hypothetical protein